MPALPVSTTKIVVFYSLIGNSDRNYTELNGPCAQFIASNVLRAYKRNLIYRQCFMQGNSSCNMITWHTSLLWPFLNTWYNYTASRYHPLVLIPLLLGWRAGITHACLPVIPFHNVIPCTSQLRWQFSKKYRHYVVWCVLKCYIESWFQCSSLSSLFELYSCD